MKDDKRRAETPVVVAEFGIAVGRQLRNHAVPPIHLPGLAGEREAVNYRSPMPLRRSSPHARAGLEITGKMVRVITFQRSFTLTGITG